MNIDWGTKFFYESKFIVAVKMVIQYLKRQRDDHLQA